MLDTKLYSAQVEQEFEKDENTQTVEIRCSLPANFLTVTVLEEIQDGVDRDLSVKGLTVETVRFTEDSLEPDSKDFFLKVTKVV